MATAKANRQRVLARFRSGSPVIKISELSSELGISESTINRAIRFHSAAGESPFSLSFQGHQYKPSAHAFSLTNRKANPWHRRIPNELSSINLDEYLLRALVTRTEVSPLAIARMFDTNHFSLQKRMQRFERAFAKKDLKFVRARHGGPRKYLKPRSKKLDHGAASRPR